MTRAASRSCSSTRHDSRDRGRVPQLRLHLVPLTVSGGHLDHNGTGAGRCASIGTLRTRRMGISRGVSTHAAATWSRSAPLPSWFETSWYGLRDPCQSEAAGDLAGNERAQVRSARTPWPDRWRRCTRPAPGPMTKADALAFPDARAYPSAMCAAPCSWRVVIRRMPGSSRIADNAPGHMDALGFRTRLRPPPWISDFDEGFAPAHFGYGSPLMSGSLRPMGRQSETVFSQL